MAGNVAADPRMLVLALASESSSVAWGLGAAGFLCVIAVFVGICVCLCIHMMRNADPKDPRVRVCGVFVGCLWGSVCVFLPRYGAQWNAGACVYVRVCISYARVSAHSRAIYTAYICVTYTSMGKLIRIFFIFLFFILFIFIFGVSARSSASWLCSTGMAITMRPSPPGARPA